MKYQINLPENSEHASRHEERRLSHLHKLRGEAPGDEDPVGCGKQAVSHHRAEDERAQLLPLLTQVVWVDLSEEDGENHSQDSHQVHLPPVLQRQEVPHGQQVCAWPRSQKYIKEQKQDQSI